MTGTTRTTLAALALAAASALAACGPAPDAPRPEAPLAPAPAAAQGGTDATIRFLEDRVRRDPDDFIAQNKLAACYLGRLRESGSLAFLELATRAAEASVAAMPAEMNAGGLAALAQAQLSAHEFAEAADNARRLAELEPREAYPLQILGDALLELGDYDGASACFSRLARAAGTGFSAESRLGKLAALRGDLAAAREHAGRAVDAALAATAPGPEAVAWCQWQAGEASFACGDYEAAERHAREALATLPGYYRAVASLGRALAARGDLEGAIAQYELASRVLPDPAYVGALGDLYAVAGRDAEARAQYELVGQIARLSRLNGALYNRQLALFDADHDVNAEEAYANAAGEYAVRRDVYGADALAWAALKAGRLEEARAAMGEALRLGTRDARLFYHAGMIALAAGDRDAARARLSEALSLSPRFDPLQAPKARAALDGLGG